MTYIQQIEALLAIMLTLFETQIKTINILGPHAMRPVIVEHTEQLAQALMSYIELIEQQFIKKVEKEVEQVLEQSASMVKVLTNAKEEMPEMKMLHELFTTAQANHGNITNTLSEEEERVTAAMIARFAMMKSRISTLLAVVRNM